MGDECNPVDWILSPIEARGLSIILCKKKGNNVMGYIYKITNTLNNKVYIGQTIKTIEKRFQQHKNNSNKSYFSQIVLYKAFNKYGIENFVCEEIEQVENNLLDEREKYWIEYYNSFFNGYNSTLGGRATQLYNWDTDDIIEKYQELKSARKVANEIGCDHSTVDRILNENGVMRFSPAQQQSKALEIIDKNNQIHKFETTTDAANWLIENKFTKMTNPKIVRQEICDRIRKNKKYLGMEIYYQESKRQSVLPVTEE